MSVGSADDETLSALSTAELIAHAKQRLARCGGAQGDISLIYLRAVVPHLIERLERLEGRRVSIPIGRGELP